MPNPDISVQLPVLLLECWGLLSKGEVGRNRYQTAKSAIACSLVATKHRWAAFTARTGACFKYKTKSERCYEAEKGTPATRATPDTKLPLGFSMTLCEYFGCACPEWLHHLLWIARHRVQLRGGWAWADWGGKIPILQQPGLGGEKVVLLSWMNLIFKGNGCSSYICKGILLEIKN